MQIGIVGLPNVGKSSLFNALTSGHAASSNYPFTTIDPNVGVVAVPDTRLKRLTQVFVSQSTIAPAINFVDIAGLVKGASQGEGLGNKFLSHIREVDAIIHLVRLFEDADVVHTLGSVDPKRDVEVIETELILSDIQAIDKQIEKNQSAVKAGNKEAKERAQVMEKIREGLSQGKPALTLGFAKEELAPYFLLTAKPVLFVGNTPEGGSDEGMHQGLRALTKERGSVYLDISVKLESEIAQIADAAERQTFLQSMGLERSGLDRVILAAQEALGLITFFTAGPKETRGWNVVKGAKAPQAAGKIHTDMEKGFIRADTYTFADIDRLGTEIALRDAGLIRSEGKEYVVKDGDVMFFKFSK
ncbi:MAG: redox-regulated ATPase YchF [Elusimicrobiota bacterium]